MRKINDRIYLGMISGTAGFVALTLIDVISSSMKISQRSYRTTAAGVWVASRRQAEKWPGQILGVMMNIGLSMIGGVAVVKMLTTFGRDKLVPKGLFFGATFGSIITAMLSGLSSNKVKPKDAWSNLSFMVSHFAFGLATIFTAAKIGDDTLFDTPPQNDYLKPTKQTTEQLKGPKSDDILYSDINPNLEGTTIM
ncbi:hypothetical protein [Desulfosporosinus sp. Sb-LF]|uniref:hypothetical protein n=1 Tax=Desulfosporosinus sp. Sb-LF TaxID=2560027 RepID=UPI001FB124C6|nr:hypothetical protein [Desulfosporosinus sp. Sb-LF]